MQTCYGLVEFQDPALITIGIKLYSEDPNTVIIWLPGQVWYLNGPIMSGCQMVWFLNGGLKTKQKMYVLWKKCPVFKWFA